jgi:murein DD-endopeptidase MepM/ murein hydrolase activator NlpD
VAVWVLVFFFFGQWVLNGHGPEPAAAQHRAMPAAPTANALGHDDLWEWPVVSRGHVLQGFRAPATRYAAGHRGIDLAAHPGEPVVAPAPGVIRFRGRVVDRDVVTIAVANGILVSLEPVTSTRSPGEVVAEGDLLGTVSTGGHCDGCVHVGVRVNGEYVSPLAFFAGVPRAVLLPLH